MNRPHSEHGYATIPALAAMGAFMFILLLTAQFVVWQYGRGAVRSALSEAAQAGSSYEGDPAACAQEFEVVRQGLLGGSIGDGVGAVQCSPGPNGTYIATVQVTFDAWVPVTPDWTFTVSAVAAQERLP